MYICIFIWGGGGDTFVLHDLHIFGEPEPLMLFARDAIALCHSSELHHTEAACQTKLGSSS